MFTEFDPGHALIVVVFEFVQFTQIKTFLRDGFTEAGKRNKSVIASSVYHSVLRHYEATKNVLLSSIVYYFCGCLVTF